MSRKKGEKKQAKVMHAETNEGAVVESDSFFLFFQSNLSLIGTEASPFGGDAITSHAYLPHRCGSTR